VFSLWLLSEGKIPIALAGSLLSLGRPDLSVGGSHVKERRSHLGGLILCNSKRNQFHWHAQPFLYCRVTPALSLAHPVTWPLDLRKPELDPSGMKTSKSGGCT
jgi:hypothetical protein